MTIYLVNTDEEGLTLAAFTTRQKAEEYIKQKDEAYQEALTKLGVTWRVTCGLGIEEVEVQE